MTNDEDTMRGPQDAMAHEAGQHSSVRFSRAGFFKVATATALSAAGALMYTTQPTLAASNAKQAGTISQAEKTQPGLYYIQSMLTGFVLDIPYSDPAPRALVSVHPRNWPFSYNQLWFVAEDGYIQSLLNGFVLDVLGANMNARASVAMYPKNFPPSPNQHWFISDSYIYTALDGMVLDVSGSDTAPDAPVIVFPKNSPRSSNQQWMLVPAF